MQLRLLGTFDITMPDSEYSIPTAKSRLLLSWLMLATQSSQPRKSLATRFWPDIEPDRAMHNLRMALSFLRPFALPNRHGILDISAQTVQVVPNETLEVDAWRVEQLLQYIDQHAHRSAIRCQVCMSWYEEIYTLFRGPLLDGITVDDAPELAFWLDMERERWLTIYHRVCWQLAQWYNITSRFEEAIVLVRRYIEQNPWHEEAQYLYMELNMRMGDRTRALHVAQHYESLIKREFGAVPQQATQQLISQIRAHTWIEPKRVPQVNVPRVPFFGRRDEIRTLQRVISESRFQLISIVGPGGCGKTMLSYHAARACAGLFAHGTYFVALEHARGENELLHALARAFRLQLNPVDALLPQLTDKLATIDALIVLDNCEHLLDQVGVLISLIDACPTLMFFVTSRLPFSVSYEYRMFLTGLPFQATEHTSVTESDAVKLFLSRAEMHDALRDWHREIASIIELCRVLDGMPLAIELAAGLSRSMPCSRVLQLVNQRLDVLTADTRDTPSRHHSLIVVFDEMWFRLSELQRNVMHQMMVFQGGFDDDALRTIVSGHHDDATIDVVLRQLHDAGMVRFSQMRYEIHPMLRQYVIAQHVVDAQVQAAHMRYYLGVIDNPALYHISTSSVPVAQELVIEFDNLRAAWQYGVAHHHVARIATCARPFHALAVCIGRVPEVADMFRESVVLFDRDGVTDCDVHIQLALWEGRLRHRLGDYYRMVEVATRVIRHANGVMMNEVAMAHALISVMESSQGQGVQALQRLNAVLPHLQPHAHEVLADLYMRRSEALIFTQADSNDEVTHDIETALRHYQMVDDVIGIVYCHIWLAYRWVFMGDPAKTVTLLQQTLTRAQQIGDRRVIGLLLAHVGSVQVLLVDRSPLHISTIEEGLQHIRAISDWVCELEVVHLLIYAHIECGNYDQAIQILNAMQTRIVQHGNAIQQLHFVDACGLLCMALGQPSQAVTIFTFVVNYPSTHAHYRVLRQQTLATIEQTLTPKMHEVALQRAEVLQNLPLVEAIQQVFLMVSHLDMIPEFCPTAILE